MSFLSVGLPLPILVGVAYAMGVKNFLLAAIPIVLLWKWRRVYVIVKTFPRDVRFLYRMRRLVSNTKSYEKNNKTVVSVFQENVLKNPDRPIYVLGDEVWTYKDVDQYSNKIANIFHKAGFAKKDVVALMMQNSPAYVSIWLGLAKIGVITALINTNLKGPSLKHCVNTASCKAIIFADEFFEVVLESCNDLKLYQSNGNPTSSKVINLEKLMAETSNELLEKKDIMYTDKLLYIYTSGTTGMPKAAILPHSRYILGTMATMCLLNAERSDIIYNPLPLYHTAGGALGVGPALLEGLTTVLRVKFSASAYISDCIKYKCTIGQYIGEMCRYMLATPPKPEDTMHNLKFMIGNGLRPAIWSAFVERFRIPQITEVYGSTEGNVNIANIDNTVGAVGSVPQFLPNSLIPVAIVKIDMETEEPIRDCDGLCKRCDKDETGMFVGLIKNNDPSRQYHGYVNQADSKKKVWRDVFSKGDSVFVSGDLMLMDEFGYIYFKDRTGDTYRWKGENIATSEVEAVISSVAGLRDCSVYGVKIGDLEGKAGMAAVVDPNNQLDLQMFTNGVDNSLPIAARPIFLRVLPSMEMTGTYKMKKVLLQKDGFDPDIIKDKLYFRQGPTFVPLTKTLYTSIINGDIKI